MTRFEASLAILDHDIGLAGGREEYVIGGSASVILRGIIDREPGDIDIFTTRSLWGGLLGMSGYHVETPWAGDPPILVKNTPIPLSIFFDWRDDHVSMDIPNLLRDAEMVDGFRCAPVADVLRHKQEAMRHGAIAAKHIPDILSITKWLEIHS